MPSCCFVSILSLMRRESCVSGSPSRSISRRNGRSVSTHMDRCHTQMTPRCNLGWPTRMDCPCCFSLFCVSLLLCLSCALPFAIFVRFFSFSSFSAPVSHFHTFLCDRFRRSCFHNETNFLYLRLNPFPSPHFSSRASPSGWQHWLHRSWMSRRSLRCGYVPVCRAVYGWR